MSEAAPPLRCHVLDSHQALAALRVPWQALCDQCPWATPFQRPDWLLPWARHLGAAEPWPVAVWEGDRLVGLAPLFRYQRPGPRGKQRVLAFLGAGISDYLDVLIAPGREAAVLPAMLDALGARRAEWDVCELDEVRPLSPLARALPAGWSTEASLQSVCPALPLPARVDALDEHVPARHLARFHRYRRRAARAGTLRLERAAPHTCERLLDALFRLHEIRWQGRGEPGMLAWSSMRAFHREVAAAFAARDALALYGLRVDGRLVACLYGLEDHGTLCFYLSGFDPDVAHLSPGVLVLGMVIEEAVRRGLTCFDFLRGGEPYKYWWGASNQHTVRMRLHMMSIQSGAARHAGHHPERSAHAPSRRL